MKDCPPNWPATKCPKELCFQIGSQPDDRISGTCWRCKAARAGASDEERERLWRPGVDRAIVEKFVVTPEERRELVEEQGFCWFCGCKQGCKSCEVYVDSEKEKMLGKNALRADIDSEKNEGKPAQRNKTIKAYEGAWQKSPRTAAPRRNRRAKSRLQARDGEFSRTTISDLTRKGLPRKVLGTSTSPSPSLAPVWDQGQGQYQQHWNRQSMTYTSDPDEVGMGLTCPHDYSMVSPKEEPLHQECDTQAYSSLVPQDSRPFPHTQQQRIEHQTLGSGWQAFLHPDLLDGNEPICRNMLTSELYVRLDPTEHAPDGQKFPSRYASSQE